jgi:nucleoside-diphosphate-sugar epimerase
MRVLVTGAAGFIGSRIAAALVERGDEVTAVVRPDADASRVSRVQRCVRIAPCDLEDRASVATLLRREAPDALVHAAWYANPRDYLGSKRNLASLAMTIALYEEALAAGARKLVGVGSCLEYAASDEPRRETDRCDPETLYASCKYAAYLTLRALTREADAELVWARVFHVHGPGESPGRLLASAAAALRAGRSFDLTSGGQVRDHLHVADVGRAVALLVAPGVVGPVNVCSGKPVRLRDVLLTLGELLGRPELLRFGALPDRPGEVQFLAGDAARLRALGFKPRFSTLRDGLADALQEDAIA